MSSQHTLQRCILFLLFTLLPVTIWAQVTPAVTPPPLYIALLTQPSFERPTITAPAATDTRPIIKPITPDKPVKVNPTIVNLTLLPTTVSLLGELITLTNCNYTSSSANGVCGSGTLKLALKSADHPYTYNLPVTFRDMKLDNAKVQACDTMIVGASILDNFAGTGFNIDEKGGEVRLAPDVVQLVMPASVTTPYQNSSGKRYQVDYIQEGSALTLSIAADGAITGVGGGLTKPRGAKLMSFNPAGVNGIVSGGLMIIPDSTDLAIRTTEAAAPTFSLTCKEGTAFSQIPNLLLVDSNDLPLQFTNLKISQFGEVTASQMTLPPDTEAEVGLLSPADFLLHIISARVSIEKGIYTEFTLTASPILPTCLPGEDGKRVSLPAVYLDMLKLPVIDYANPPKVTIPVNPRYGGRTMTGGGALAAGTEKPITIVVNGYNFECNGLVLDLSRTEAPGALTPTITSPMWQGVYARTVNVTLPTSVWKDINGKSITLPAKNWQIGSRGLTGQLNASGDVMGKATLGGFQANITGLQSYFSQNIITSTDCRGSVHVFGDVIPLVITMASEGATARVEKPTTVVNERLGVSISITNGSLQPDANNKYALWVDGALTLDVKQSPSLKNSPLGFHHLGVLDNGDLVTTHDGWLTLDTPADADFDLFRCHLTSLAFTKQANAKWAIDLAGDISLNSDVPINRTIAAQTFRLMEDAGSTDAAPQPASLDVKALDISADVDGIIGVRASLNLNQDDPVNPHLRGKADLILSFISDKPIGGKFDCYMGKQSVWGVAGELNLPPEAAIPLANSDLGLYRFTGGLAHNMLPKSTGSGAHTATGVMGSFGSIDDLVAKPGLGNWLFAGGAGVVLISDPALFHAYGDLTVSIPDCKFNMHADAWILSDVYNPPGQIVVDIAFDPGIPAFAADASLDIGVPDKRILELSGTVGVYISPDDQHIQMGWPYPENAVSSKTLGGVLSGRAGCYFSPLSNPALQACYGTGLDYKIFSGSIDASLAVNYQTAPYLVGAVWASGSVDFYIASLSASAALNAAIYDDYMAYDGSFRATIHTPWPAPDIHVSTGFSGTYP